MRLVEPLQWLHNSRRMRRPGAQLLLFLSISIGPTGFAITLSNSVYHVFPGDNIQEAIQLAAENKTAKTVRVHAGEYRPDSKRQAMIWFNKSHDGIRLEAEGRVMLTAANPQIAAASDPGYPAIVNHVVYFGNGITSNTVLKGFCITGANNFVTREDSREIEPDRTIPK